MPIIKLETRVNAPVDLCFDISRSIDIHMDTMKASGEKAIGGVTTGMIEEGQTVTWQARHFLITMQLTSKITEMKRPNYFIDEMTKGPFKRIHHRHIFEQKNGYTLITDEFNYAAPLGPLGKLAEWLVLTRYMKNLLVARNNMLKSMAEAGA